MSISCRNWIRWLPDAASEPTSTMVLTSPERRFVDIRILRGLGEEYAGLDWAFAGYSTSEPVGNGVQHCTWRHVADSRMQTLDGAEAIDEGDNHPLEDGRTLETGRMMNPATGELTDYEELWTDLKPREIHNDTEGSAATGHQTRARCIVLELKDQEGEQRGMVIGLGRYSLDS
ncbi:hypothetical protein F4777DRAFT_599004 [Nemania sp. FL0916]|nr:hypothetical protein F4777DRAFT_599004 [Nemania sp. FL0916]